MDLYADYPEIDLKIPRVPAGVAVASRVLVGGFYGLIGIFDVVAFLVNFELDYC